ncbi:MAG: AMP-binding protein, partial [Rhodospirillales bacterium]|nr:AMP-binding protein [Rhodospirillales bacterium]
MSDTENRPEKIWPWEKSMPDDVDWREPVDTYGMPDAFEDTIRQFADRPAIDFLDRIYKYSELGDLVHRAAKGLQALGVTKGSRVGLMAPNCPAYVIFYWG